MAALNRRRRAWAALLSLVLALAAGASAVSAAPPKKKPPAKKPAATKPAPPKPEPAEAPPAEVPPAAPAEPVETAPPLPDAAPAGAPTDPAGLVAAAEAAFSEAEFEKVRDLAGYAVKVLGDAPPPDVPPEALAGHQRLRARAFDLLAQAHYNLGTRGAVTPTIDRLLETDPGYRVDPAVAGPKFVELVEGRRRKLVGTIVPVCTPGPCETVTVDGRAARPDSEGNVPALAGARRVTLGRRNFRDTLLEGVTVVAGERVTAQAALEQVARDLALATEPGAVKVTVDGRDLGTTAPGPDPNGPSRPLVIPALPPGPHVLVFQAPCRRRLEQQVEVVLDAQQQGAQDLGTIVLERSRAAFDITWSGPAGALTVDGQAVQPGTVEVCPGPHEVSASVGGRRVWFQTIELHEEETAAVAPRPRPTVAVLRQGTAWPLPGFPGRAWNEVPLAAPAAEGLAGRLAGQLPAGPPPIFPAVARVTVAGLAAEAKKAAPEADLVALFLPGNDPVRPVRLVALIDTGRDVAEISGWPESDTRLAGQVAEELGRGFRAEVPFFGFDLADRAGAPPVVGAVLPVSPASKAGLVAGQVVVAVAGKPLASLAEIPPVTELPIGTPLVLRVADAKGERDVQVTPIPAVHAPNPAVLAREAGVFLLPLVARAEVARVAGTPVERQAGSLVAGLALVAAGLPAEAAPVLDRAAIDESLDPAGDARGTQFYVLEQVLLRIGRKDYAAEVRARWTPLDRARLGGRGGPALGAAAAGD